VALPAPTIDRLVGILGTAHVRADAESCATYGTDALKKGHPADVVVFPGSTEDVSRVMRICHDTRTPVVPRGAGTGYTGGAVPIRGGVVMSLERMNRIVEIDQANLLAVVEPFVVTGNLADAVERVGLFYPPDPASLRQSTIGGNVAENAGGPRAFKYGVTRQYVLGLDAVMPNGDVIRTGGKVVKNVVGYDLTQLLVGSEGTLAVITRIVLRLMPLPPDRATLRATFSGVREAVDAVGRLVSARVVPAALEFVDHESLEAVRMFLGGRQLAPPGTGALLLVEVDGTSGQVATEAELVAAACREAGALDVLRAADAAERAALWSVRRELSPSLRVVTPMKVNHDVVVPKARVPQLMDLVAELRRRHGLRIPCFGHIGDGNIHVNIMVTPDDAAEAARARVAERELFEGVVALEGSISGEHGIGFSKAPYLALELSPETIAVMRAVKAAFDPTGILNPGKIL
jgi:glycolate oxidase